MGLTGRWAPLAGGARGAAHGRTRGAPWAVLLLLAILRRAATQQPSGCGREYVERIEEYVRASGSPLHVDAGSSAPADLTKRRQLEQHREACAAAVGCFAQVQVDLLGYSKRQAAELAGEASGAMQQFHDFYAASLTPQDKAELQEGVAFCVPRSCDGQLEMLPVLTRMYFFSLAGITDDLDFPAFQVGLDINATFTGPRLGAATAPPQRPRGGGSAGAVRRAVVRLASAADPVAAAAQCVMEAQKVSADGAPYGVAFIPRRICEESDSIPPVLLQNIGQCSQQGGRLKLVRFDLHTYAARASSEDATRWDGKMVLSLKRLGEFYEGIATEIVRDFSYGFGLCLPPACNGEGRRGLPRVLLEMLVGLAADADSSMAHLSSDLLPDPRWGTDMNVTGWSSTIPEGSRARACVPQDELEMEEGPEGAVLSWEGQGLAPELDSSIQDEAGWEEADETPGLLNGTGFQVPWWYSCDGPSMPQEWQAFAQLMRAAFVRGVAGPINQTLVEMADHLVSTHWSFAQDWAHWVAKYSKLTCNLEYTHIQDLSSNVEFSPAFYMLAGNKRRTDSRWWRIGSWRLAATFCPYGFLAALYVRARSLRAAGLRTSAVKDLELARKMLGGCSEMDLLDRHVWGVRALDFELNLLREELPEVEAFAGAACASAGNGSGQCPAGGGQGVSLIAGGEEFFEPQNFTEIWRQPLYDWRSFAWHAMQLNALIRVWTREAARGSDPAKPPPLAMLTFPHYLCLFLVPALLRLWGAALQLALFYIGKKWETHDKCLDCMDDYGKRFVMDTPYLQELPMKVSGLVSEAKTTLHIDWALELTFHEMLSLFRDFMEQQPRVRTAEVFLCTAPLWLCTSLRMVSTKPIITLCLPNIDLGAPPDLKETSTSGTRAHRRIRRSAFRHFIKDLPSGPPLRALWVREDMWRSYHDSGSQEVGFALPFVAGISIYLKARYKCDDDSNVLVMREGSQYRWAPSLRGRLFYSTLKQFETHSSPWRFRILSYSLERLTFDEIANHRAALWIQLPMSSKITIKDLISMEIPLFVPTEALQASISARIQFHGCRGLSRASAPWAYTLCREVKYPMTMLQMSPIFRYPHALHFESITDLMRQLASHGCDDLRVISARMHRWNEALVADDAEFWRNAVLGLAAWGAGPTPAGGGAAPAGAPGGAASPPDLPPFRLPQGPPSWAPAGGELTEPCGPLAAHCPYESEQDGDEPPQGEFPQDFTSGPYECCADAYALEHGPLGPNASLATAATAAGGAVASAGAGCLADPARCDDAVLRYGIHLLQELPPLDGSG